MKVSIYTPSFFSIDTGGGNVVFQLGQFLAKAGINVVLFTFTKAYDAFSSLLSEGVITLEGVTIRKYEPKMFRIIGMRPQLYSRQLIKEISQEHSDIVHMYSFSQFPLLFSILKRAKAPVVLSPTKIHEGFQNISSRFHKNLLTRTIQYTGKRVSCFVVDTLEDKKALVSAGIEEQKIGFIRHSIDYSKMAAIKRREEDVILAVGRYAPDKGFHNLIDAARLILHDYPHIKFYLVGAVFDKKYHEFLVKKIGGIEGQIYLTGSLEEAKLLNLFSRAKLFVLPSINDAHGLVAVEAMAAGIPVVASKVAGISPLIEDGVSGVLVPPNDVPALAGSVLDLWKNNEKRAVLIKKGKETAKRYYWQIYAQRTIQLYSEIASKKKTQ